MLGYALAIIIVGIISLVVSGVIFATRYDKYLEGMWTGNSAFLEKAELSDMQLFIAPIENGVQKGYLIITDLQGEFISNQAIEIKKHTNIKEWISALRATYTNADDKYTINDLEIIYSVTKNLPIPTRVKLSISMLNGTISLYDDKKMYTFMQKDLVSSTIGVDAYKYN